MNKINMKANIFENIIATFLQFEMFCVVVTVTILTVYHCYLLLQNPLKILGI